MNGYQHLGLVERRQIYQLAATGRSVHQIAASLQRHRSTIYRELKRNQHLDDEPVFRGYFPTAAQTMADRRRVRGGKIARKPELAAYIADRLSAAWSPEQIAGYLRRHRGNHEAVCHETYALTNRPWLGSQWADMRVGGTPRRRTAYDNGDGNETTLPKLGPLSTCSD